MGKKAKRKNQILPIGTHATTTTLYAIGQNMPGYLPMADELYLCTTFDDAKRALIAEMDRSADHAPECDESALADAIDAAAATLAALPDSPDVRTAAAMLAAAPTTASGTLRKWMTAHDGVTVDTLQFRTWCGHDTLAVWAPTDRTIDASRAGSVRFNGSTLDYRGVRVIGADDVSIVTLSDEFLTVYRLSSARPAAEVVTDPDAAPTD